MEDDEVDGFHAAQQGSIDGNAVDGLLRHHDGEKPTDIQMRRSCTWGVSSNGTEIWDRAQTFHKLTVTLMAIYAF